MVINKSLDYALQAFESNENKTYVKNVCRYWGCLATTVESSRTRETQQPAQGMLPTHAAPAAALLHSLFPGTRMNNSGSGRDNSVGYVESGPAPLFPSPERGCMGHTQRSGWWLDALRHHSLMIWSGRVVVAYCSLNLRFTRTGVQGKASSAYSRPSFHARRVAHSTTSRCPLSLLVKGYTPFTSPSTITTYICIYHTKRVHRFAGSIGTYHIYIFCELSRTLLTTYCYCWRWGGIINKLLVRSSSKKKKTVEHTHLETARQCIRLALHSK